MGAHPLRIGLRVLSNPHWRGGINYIINWSAALSALPDEERPEIILLPFDEAGEHLVKEWPIKVDGVAPFAAAGQLELDFVYPATQIFEAPFGVPWAGWIPDWQCKHLPEMFSPLERSRRDLHYKLLAKESPALALSSRMALEETMRLVPDAVDAHVLHFPVLLSDADRAALSDVSKLLAKHGLPERYVIVCNQFWRHKNHALVLEALARIKSSDLVCVMTGEMHDERWPQYIEDLRRLTERPEIASHLRLLGSISRREQLALMAHAVAIVQPSLFEGWSTVVEEARLLGVPSLLSRFPVHEEQNPPKSRFFDPQNPDELTAMLDEVWSQPTDLMRRSHADVEQDRFSQSCARSFLALAKSARKNYVAEKNGPAAILARLIAGLPVAEPGSIEAELEARIYSGARAMFKMQPHALAEFDFFCEKEGEIAAARAEKNIIHIIRKQAALGKLAEAVIPVSLPSQGHLLRLFDSTKRVAWSVKRFLRL